MNPVPYASPHCEIIHLHGYSYGQPGVLYMACFRGDGARGIRLFSVLLHIVLDYNLHRHALPPGGGDRIFHLPAYVVENRACHLLGRPACIMCSRV